MELNVQKYLRNGKTLADLKTETGIEAGEYGNLVILNYNQIESPKTHPIVMECRQLVLEKGTWDIVFRSFYRFFNHGEALDLVQDFDYSRAVALDKIDGSIIGVFHYDGKWLMTTRGVIDGGCQVGTFPLTFKELFNLAVAQYPNFWTTLDEMRALGEDYCYTFELTSPENRVVTPYADRALHLLTIRDRKRDFVELPHAAVIEHGLRLGTKLPTLHHFSNITELMKMAANVGELNEGFVCIDYTKTDDNGNFRRMKVKNPAYLAVAHLKESSAASLRSLLQLVILGEINEFIAYFPEFIQYTSMLEKTWNEYYRQLSADLVTASTKKNLTRKEYAEWAKTCINSGILFQFFDDRVTSVQDWLEQMMAKGEKSFGKNMMQILKINDIEWELQK